MSGIINGKKVRCYASIGGKCGWIDHPVDPNGVRQHNLEKGDHVVAVESCGFSYYQADVIRGVVLGLCSCGWADGNPENGVWVKLDTVEHPRLCHFAWLARLSPLEALAPTRLGPLENLARCVDALD